MRLSLHVIGLTTALLLGGASVTANPVLSIEPSKLNPTSTQEVVTVQAAKAPESATAIPAATAPVSAATVYAAAVKPTSHIEELKENLYEVGKALKEGGLAAVQVISGVCNVFVPVANILMGTAKLGLSLVKFVWFTGKVAYTTGSVLVEGVQTVHAYFTK